MKTTLSLTAKKFLDNVHGLIIVLSPKGEVQFVNSYASGLLGYDREEIIGKNWFDHFVPKDQRSVAKKKFKQFINCKAQHTMAEDQYIETKDGDLHLIEWHDTHLQDRDENIIGTFASGENITEKHLLKLYLADQIDKHRQERLNGILEASERERKFLAYELHDGVNQVLTTCKLLLETEIANGNDSHFIQRTTNLIQEVIANLRELSHELNPAGLGNEGLFAAAQELVARINLSGKIEISTDVKGYNYVKKLPSHLSLSLFRIMQEALTNIIKHADAKKVKLKLVSSASAVDLEIIDDGKGFDRSRERSGLGLRTIYTRAEAAGGKAHIMSTPGEGTILSVHIPV